MALVAALTGEPARAEVERLLRDRKDPPQIAAVNLAEVLDVMVRVKSFRREQVDHAIGWLRAGGLEVVPTDEAIGLRAGELRSRHYHHQSAAVSICDCVALATASVLAQSLATADPALAALARAEGTTLVPVADSHGLLP
jgi:PIN domain nuclease of toxin-antitoxin system